jgi:hypothetical protein
MRVWVGGAGVVGPGLAGWTASRAVLGGRQDYVDAPTVCAPIESLPAVERRRLGLPVKLAIVAGLDAFRDAAQDPKSTATVFTSSGGDGENVHRICESLASAEREMSPTRFHNAVHNAAAGYWSITTGAQAPSTSLCCHDASVAAGLLEAAVQVTTDGAPVALIAYDHRYPEPLHAVRPIAADLGVALILLPQPAGKALCLDITVVRGSAHATPMAEAPLEALRANVPAGRALPLLAALARGTTATVILDYMDSMRLRVDVIPASSEHVAFGATPDGR